MPTIIRSDTVRQYLCRLLSLVVAAMDKAAAAKFLGVSQRTIERYVKDKKIGVVYVNGTPTYSEEELTRFKDELQAPIHQPSLAPTMNDMDLSPFVAPAQIDEGLECLKAIAHHYYLVGLQSKMVLSLSEAALISGISEKLLRTHIKAGSLKAIRLGKGWKLRQVDLQDFVDQLFNQVPLIGAKPNHPTR
ncbi:helix-turn-helix domain-containing protein [Iningainema tapete]|uniref:Helix-turn-helix domain-containing protein n=1 Tax=Iningainema tapete BLCC-T55 TaxID=2748662 RepID=A0A8J6XEL3_9CYAN|nr:helix-turn-helix domain-containing protein [Iningainema tapete]MBD2771162.1 helix-turn-helix domain-containing protein [Iningainema tapete BLCC-T55]